MIKILILRHGPTQWNADKRIQGHSDIPLGPQGQDVVRNWQIPKTFINFDCTTSPLSRAQETARLLNLSPQPNAALTEMSWGEWEGQSLADLRAKLGDEMTQNESRGLDFCPPGGESPRDVQNRLKPWLKSLSTSTIVVAHRGIIRALYALANGWDMQTKSPERIEKFAAHLFSLDDLGQPTIERLNIDLEVM